MFGRTTLALSFGEYKPNLDSEKTSTGNIFPIYGCFYKDANLPEVGADADFHVWDGFGSLQLSLGLAVSQASGFTQPLSTTSTGACGTPTTTPTQLTMLKLKPGVTYRFDPLLDSVGFPLVPYGRIGLIGLGYMFTTNGKIDTGGQAQSKPVNPLGARFGYEAAVGLSLALDFLDPIDPFIPDTTQRARSNGAFEHSYLFVEGAFQDITTFGQPGFVFSPSENLFATGWPVTLRAGVAVELF
jgi:hypothetical protein